MKNPERRMAVSDIEVRGSDDAPVLTGYASTFGQPYDMGWYTETVAQGAFSRTLSQSPDVRLLVNHGGLPLARTTSGTLQLSQDSHGLLVRAELDASDPDVQALIPKMRRGDLNQMSFGFRTIEDVWENDMSQRTLRALDLNDGDASVVTYPANPTTTAVIRAVGGSRVDAIASALRAMEARAATDEDIASVLTRALGYFTAIDTIVDNAQEELAEALDIPNPDDEESEATTEMLAAQTALELRKLRLRLAG